jgi:hypothetical protein
VDWTASGNASDVTLPYVVRFYKNGSEEVAGRQVITGSPTLVSYTFSITSGTVTTYATVSVLNGAFVGDGVESGEQQSQTVSTSFSSGGVASVSTPSVAFNVTTNVVTYTWSAQNAPANSAYAVQWYYYDGATNSPFTIEAANTSTSFTLSAVLHGWDLLSGPSGATNTVTFYGRVFMYPSGGTLDPDNAATYTAVSAWGAASTFAKPLLE